MSMPPCSRHLAMHTCAKTHLGGCEGPWFATSFLFLCTAVVWHWANLGSRRWLCCLRNLQGKPIILNPKHVKKQKCFDADSQHVWHVWLHRVLQINIVVQRKLEKFWSTQVGPSFPVHTHAANMMQLTPCLALFYSLQVKPWAEEHWQICSEWMARRLEVFSAIFGSVCRTGGAPIASLALAVHRTCKEQVLAQHTATWDQISRWQWAKDFGRSEWPCITTIDHIWSHC